MEAEGHPARRAGGGDRSARHVAGVEDGHKSVAVEIVLQPTAKSFTDEEIKAIADKVSEDLKWSLTGEILKLDKCRKILDPVWKKAAPAG